MASIYPLSSVVSLETARARRERVEDFECDKEALLKYNARLVPEDLDGTLQRWGKENGAL